MSSEIVNQSVGKVNVISDNDRLLGVTGEIEDSEPGTGSQLQVKNSGMLTKVRVVKFTGAFAPSSRVKYTSGKAGTEVEQAGAAEKANGVVDPRLSANTANGDIGLIYYEGPTDVIASAAIAANAKFKGAASGKVVTDSTVGDNLTEGVAIEAASGDGDKIRALVQFPQY